MISEGIISHARAGNINVCIYGLGYLGMRLYEVIPEIFDLKAEYYCDGNNERVRSTTLCDMKRIYKTELIESDTPFLVFVLVDDPYDLEIQRELSQNDKLYTLTLREMAQMEDVMKKFYGDDLFGKIMALPNYSDIGWGEQ